MFGELKGTLVCGVAGHVGILFAFSASPTQRRGVNQRSILSRVQLLAVYTALASRPACPARYRILRPVSLALPAALVLYPLPFSPPPTRHAVGDATRPHRVTRIDLISSFIPRIAHSSFRASSATCVRMCGEPPDHARASGGTLPQQVLETRTSPYRGSALRLQCSPCPE